MSLVENRYAEALLEIAAERDLMDAFAQDLSIFAGIYGSEPELRDFLLNPQNEMKLKKDIVQSSFAGRFHPLIINFISLVVEKGRIKYLPGICREFVKLADEKRSILNIDILSAAPLDEGQLKVITEKYRKLYNKASVKAHVKLDPGLMGGIKVAVGGKMTDASLKGRLKELEQLLMK